MGFHFHRVVPSKRFLQRSISNSGKTLTAMTLPVPKGHFAAYVGESEKKRFVVPVSLLSQPSFQDLLVQVEDEYGFDHSMGGLTLHCSEDTFVAISCQV